MGGVPFRRRSTPRLSDHLLSVQHEVEAFALLFLVHPQANQRLGCVCYLFIPHLVL